MRLSKLAPLAGVLILAAPPSAQAAQTLSLSFTGTTAPSISSDVYLYPPSSTDILNTFVGPVTIDISIADYLTDPYVSNFSIRWADPAGADPPVTGWSDNGSPSSADPLTQTFFSTVDLSSTGGSIQIRPSFGYVGITDGHFNLDLDYTLSGPRALTSSYLDHGASGSGAVDYYINFRNYPGGGAYDETGGGEFNISSVSAIATVPEPAAWALMLVGVFSLGAALRAERRRTCVPV